MLAAAVGHRPHGGEDYWWLLNVDFHIRFPALGSPLSTVCHTFFYVVASFHLKAFLVVSSFFSVTWDVPVYAAHFL